MELIKKNIRTNTLGRTVIDQFAIDDDYNVPDMRSDVGRIISGDGNLRIEEVKKVENYVRIRGKLYFKILYVTDDSDPTLAALEGKLPFEEMVYMEEEKEGEYVVKVNRVEFTASLIHSRKLAIKAMVELAVHREQIVDEETTVDVEASGNVHKKKREIDLLEMYTSKRDIYRIKEEFSIPGTKENIGNLLWSDVALRKLDTKLFQDALMLSGELLVFCFYESQEGKIDWVEQSVPFEGRIDCVGVDETFYHHVYDELVDINVEIRMDSDGEMRALGVEATLEMRLLVYQEEKIEVLEDAYSLDKECMPKKKETLYEELIMQNHSKCKITEQLNLPELKDEILQICHSGGSLQVERMESVSEGIQIEGVIHVYFLYVKANDAVPFDMWQGMIPFSYLLESGQMCADMRNDITYGVEQLMVSLAGSDEVEIKAVLGFKSFLRRPVSMEMITDITFRPFDEEEIAKRPGIVGYVVKEGDDLWSLAKQYYTTMDGIREINEMTDNQLKKGDKILIFKENMSIL